MKMKDSGIEWIGEIPEHWEVNKIGQFFRQRNTKVSDEEYEPLSVTKKGIMPQLDNVAKSKDRQNRKLVKKNDFVINSRSDRKGSSGLSEIEGAVSLINIVLEPSEKIFGRYINFLLKSYTFVEEFYRNGHGIVDDLWTTKYSEMKSIFIPIFPLPEQQKIANFLDDKTATIERIIELTKKSIEEYKSYKKSLITETVTKGLNPDVKMKDSGIEWIGEIPEHWEVVKLKKMTLLKTGKTPSSSGQNYWGDVFNWFTPGDFYNGLILKKSNRKLNLKSNIDKIVPFYPAYSILIIGIGGTLGKIGIITQEASSNQQITAIIPDKELESKYLLYFLLACQDYIRDNTLYTTMPILNNQTLGNFQILRISIDEQQKIANFLDEKCASIDKFIEQKERLISELETYKKSMIFEYVTGKKEVL